MSAHRLPTLAIGFSLALAMTLALPTTLYAQDEPVGNEQASEATPLEMRTEQVLAVINAEAPPDIFTDGFLASLPPAQLQAIFAQLTGQFGMALSVESLEPATGSRAALAIRMERAIARGGIAIDPSEDNRISELLFQNFEPIDDNPDKIAEDLGALQGEVSAWFGPIDGGEPVIAIDSGAQMPLGSTFKLYVLAALAREVARGDRGWDDVVTLSDTRSFPSGMMQEWPKDAPVTLGTLANMMLSISDNTATDALITELGRDAVFQTVVDSGHSEARLNNPFLTTREMFLLKGGPADRLKAYQDAGPDERLAILAGIDAIETPEADIQAAFSGGPVALDVEWFANASDLANLFRFMRQTADPKAFEIMAINTSTTPSARENWAYVGYKGGSEPGVLNLTWLLTDEAGRDHALVLSWSDPEANLDQTALELIAQRILLLPR